MTPRTRALLRHRTRQAIDELVELRESDPAAAAAVRTIRLAERTLADVWGPALGMPPDGGPAGAGDAAETAA